MVGRTFGTIEPVSENGSDIPIPPQPVRYAASPEAWYQTGRSELLNTNTLEFTNGLHAMSPADRTAAAKVIIHNCQAASYQFYETNSFYGEPSSLARIF